MLRGEFWPQVAECHPVRGEHGPAEPPWQRAILLPWLAELTYKGGMSDPVQIGERIRAARQERGWTQEQLAEAVGVSRSAVAQWETGRAGQLTGNLSRIAEVLSVGIEHLTHGREKRANTRPVNTARKHMPVKISMVAIRCPYSVCGCISP